MNFLVQLDSVLFAEFLSWKESASLEGDSAFLSRVQREDISPCLSFTCSEVRLLSPPRVTLLLHLCLTVSLSQLSKSVQRAVENNSLTIEPVAMTTVPVVKAMDGRGPK